jgi:predicted ABC-type transport system involved in lysophospholipase L1 biosynthesis ATPase subunit
MRQYVAVISGAGEHPPDGSARDAAGVAVTLTGVIVRRGTLAAVGVSLQIPAGQSVALHSHVDGTAVDMLDVVAGLRRPRSGQVVVGGVPVHRVSGAAMERYRADRGLLSERFGLLSSLSVIDNVLAASGSRRADVRVRERAAELLVLTGTGHLASAAVEALTAEQQWRILVARALLPGPRLVLAEDPTPSLRPRNAARILDLLMDAHGRYGFTLLLATDRLATAARCRRLVSLGDGLVTADELTGDDDPWTRGRVDRIG